MSSSRFYNIRSCNDDCVPGLNMKPNAYLEAIDAKLATKPVLTGADMTKVQAMRAEGEAQHKAGKHDASMKALGEAKKLLGL